MAFNTEFRAKEDRIEEIELGFSLTEFLSSPYLDTIAQTIEREYYSRGVSRFHYPVILMIKLPVIKCSRKQSYVRTIHLLTEEDCFNHCSTAANTPGDKGGGAPATTNPQRIPVQVRECHCPPASHHHRNLYIMFTSREPAETAEE